jgi:hypothetical protein
MKTRFRATMALVAAAALFAAPALNPALGQSSDPSWLDDVKSDIAVEKECKVALFMNIRESTLGGRVTYEARVRCEDGRMFDASRVGDTGFFEFKACESQVC